MNRSFVDFANERTNEGTKKGKLFLFFFFLSFFFVLAIEFHLFPRLLRSESRDTFIDYETPV